MNKKKGHKLRRKIQRNQKGKKLERFIAIEGCIGAGKSTMARLLAKRFKGKALLEASRKHPFIKEFYSKPKEYAFQTEMNFILIHYHQMQKARSFKWFDRNVVVSDFLFDKDLIFARMTLENSLEFELFKNTYDYFKPKLIIPDIVLYLKAPTEFLYRRIKRRGREFERNISFEYLDLLNRKYDKYFSKFPRKKNITIDVKNIDWKENKDTSKEKIVSHVYDLISKNF